MAAATLGIDMLEVHVTFSREVFGPDVPASVTTPELRQLIDGIRFIETMKAHPVDKDTVAHELASAGYSSPRASSLGSIYLLVPFFSQSI